MKKLLPYVFSIGVCELIGISGSIFTIPAISTWYAFLKKPAFSPPNWIFGPIWTLLYFLMGLAAARIWLKSKNKKNKGLLLFTIQLGLNLLWSFFFFGLRSPLSGLIDIIFLLIAVFANIVVFYTIDRKASYLLIPYFAWIVFATALNIGIAWMN